MTNPETQLCPYCSPESQIFCCLLIIFTIAFVYISGKYDLINLICKMLEEKCKKYEEGTKND